MDGFIEGLKLGSSVEGPTDGTNGLLLGDIDGRTVGSNDGHAVGIVVGLVDGFVEGLKLGSIVDGFRVGPAEGIKVVGLEVGLNEGVLGATVGFAAMKRTFADPPEQEVAAL